MSDQQIILHATCVSVANKAVLIIGPSGAGKSSLALQMMALGAGLIADDRTRVQRDRDHIIASVPDTIAGQIEARGVGILTVPSAAPAPLALVVDMERRAQARLPEHHSHDILGVQLPCLCPPALHNADSGHFPSAVLLYMKSSEIQRS